LLIFEQDGTPDHTSAARIVLRDWNSGLFSWYTVPTDGSKPSEDAQDAAVLKACLPRKELRRARGSLVRLVPGSIDTRQINLHGRSEETERPAKRAKVTADDDDESEGDEDMAGGDSEDEDDEDDEDDETGGEGGDSEGQDEDAESGYESDNNDTPLEAPTSRKQARKTKAQALGKPQKQVSFAIPSGKKVGPTKPSIKQARVANAGGGKKPEASDDSDAYDFGAYFKH
jgi:nuclear GTP-binding protein